VNALLKELLTLGDLIRVAIVTDRAWILQNNQEVLADLRERNVRRMFENFVLVMGKAHEIEDINK
jgi:hypothetical protein